MSSDDGTGLSARYAEILDGARPDAVEYQHSRGKLTARERVALATDAGSFVEFGGLARPDWVGEDGEPVVADGVVTGRAAIDGRPIVVASYDFTAGGGSNGAIGNAKFERCIEIAASEGCPILLILEGGGHRIQEGLDSREFAVGVRLPGRLARLSGWVPSVAVIVGPAYAGPTVLAALCDHVIAVRGTALLGMGPARLVKMAVGEVMDAEAITGAQAQADNGLVDLAVDNEEAAFAAARRFFSYLPAKSGEAPPMVEAAAPDPNAEAGLSTVVPAAANQGYDVRRVIAGIVDGGSGYEIRPSYATNIVTMLARLAGRSVGIVANQPSQRAGTLDAEACEKASHFIRQCDAHGLAVVMLMDVPGLMVGSHAERSGLARRSARMLFEISRLSVPLLSVVLRKATGGAFVIMAGGRSFDPLLAVAWPSGEFAPLPVSLAVDIVYHRTIATAPDPANARDDLLTRVRTGLDVYRAAEGFGIDDVIAPADTRQRLVDALRHAPVRVSPSGASPHPRAIPPI